MKTLRRLLARMLWNAGFAVSPDEPFEVSYDVVREIYVDRDLTGWNTSTTSSTYKAPD